MALIPGDASMAADKAISYWRLPTGSRIAYVHYRTEAGRRRGTLIFLHGGPGAYAVSSNTDYIGSLSKKGFDVYIYDQVGSGLSARLANPREYTVARHVRDLECIRKTIGARKLILIGDSWGATLAAHYLQEHGDRVERAVFTSPGALNPSDWADVEVSSIGTKLSAKNVEELKRLQEQDWFQRVMSLLGEDRIEEAYRFAGDARMDALFDRLINLLLPGLVHNPASLSRVDEFRGGGWWANAMTGWDAQHQTADIKPVLARLRLPVLILRGTSDYLLPALALEYKRTFPVARYLVIKDAGHGIYYDKPSLYLDLIGAFLLGHDFRQLAAEGDFREVR